jgi:hypothetical protein
MCKTTLTDSHLQFQSLKIHFRHYTTQRLSSCWVTKYVYSRRTTRRVIQSFTCHSHNGTDWTVLFGTARCISRRWGDGKYFILHFHFLWRGPFRAKNVKMVRDSSAVHKKQGPRCDGFLESNIQCWCIWAASLPRRDYFLPTANLKVACKIGIAINDRVSTYTANTNSRHFCMDLPSGTQGAIFTTARWLRWHIPIALLNTTLIQLYIKWLPRTLYLTAYVTLYYYL